MRHLLAIDLGTSSTKTVLATDRGRIVAEATAEYPVLAPRPGWSEQRPEDWWKAAVATVRAVLRQSGVQPARVAAIGLSGQMHGSVFLDKDGRVLRPALLWNDQRTADECAEITRKAGGLPALLRMVANPALTGFTAPKVLWFRRHEPRLYGRLRQILLPKDYLRWRLTGDYATEVSDASGTLFLDIARRAWSRPLLSKLGVDPDLLPRVHESPEITGTLSAVAARELGLAPGTPVAGGAGDQAAGAVGNGIVRTGVVSAMLGTSGVVFAHADALKPDPLGRVHAFCHAVPGKWHTMGVMLAAGGSLAWFKRALCADLVDQAKRQRKDVYDLIVAEAGRAAPGADGLFFLPYLTGERSPHADPWARACWLGLGPGHGRPEMARAVLEGITYALRDSLEIMKGMGVRPRQVRLSGGGSRSAAWRRTQTDIFGAPTCQTGSSAGSAYGALLLAGVGAGVWPSVEAACQATIRVTPETRPDAAAAKAYSQRYDVFRALYPPLKPVFARMAGADKP